MIVNFDKYSLIVDGKRQLIKSAAFHYFRSPGLNVWRDRLSKLKACGYNTVDLYFNWGYHSSEPDKYDFTDNKDIRTLLEITKELGLFVIARPGPYINAEISAGGFPYWIFNVPNAILRNRVGSDFVYSPEYMAAVKEWYSRIIPVLNEFHNIIAFQIENEYSSNEAEPDYIQELHDIARSMGVRAPIFHNDALSACLYSDIVNIYACDVYPTVNACHQWKDYPDSFSGLDYLEENIRECSANSPLFIAELQAGWFDKWDGCGYDKLRQMFKKEHINIVTKTALSQGITMFNHYMGCGGTNWDKLGCPEVYTSYDFAAPVSEEGIPRENYYKSKEINYFLNSFNLASTDLISSSNELLGENSKNLFAVLREDNINKCKWLFVRNLNDERKNISISEINNNVSLKAFDMKILPINLSLYGCKVDFSSLSIFSRIEKDNYEAIFLIVEENTVLSLSDIKNKEIDSSLELEENDNSLKIKFITLLDDDLLSCKFEKDGKTTEFIFLKEVIADKAWIINDKMIIGPDYLSENSSKAAFSMKNSNQAEVRIVDFEEGYSLKSKILALNNDFKNPELKEWTEFKCAPEIDPGYDYSSWNLIDNDKFDCISNRVYDQFIWYKGSFNGKIDEIQTSIKHCYAVYLNGHQIFGHDSLHYEFGTELSEELTILIDHKYLNKNGKSNELTIFVQNMGFDKGFQNELSLTRGILSMKVFPEKAIEWRIRGGLTPEIEEWEFVPKDNLENASVSSALVWVSTNFELELNEHNTAPLFLNLKDANFDKANIYLNGYLIGHYWKSRASQSQFYLPEGFLKEQNVLSLIIWNRNNSNKNEDYYYLNKNVIINIEVNDSYKLFDVTTL